MTEAKPFEAFPGDALTFLQDLRANNERAWFNEHKKTYETAIKQPAEAFCRAMATALETLTDQPHGHKIFRIHRDVRFSKDKTPYNTHLHIAFTPSCRHAGHPRHHPGSSAWIPTASPSAPEFSFLTRPTLDVFASACSVKTVLISQS